jgi:hypothetical protein
VSLDPVVGIEARRKGLVGVEQWAERRREHFVRGVSIKALARRTALSGNTIRAAALGRGAEV